MSLQKCEKCKYDQIEHVVFHDMIVDKCADCEFIRMNSTNYEMLIEKCIYERNIANIRSYIDVTQISEADNKKLDKFRRYFKFDSFKLIDRKYETCCNVCETRLHQFENRFHSSFTILYCSYCDSIYFSKSDFNEFLDMICDRMAHPSIFSMIKRFFMGK